MTASRSRRLASSLAVLVGLVQPLLSSPARAIAILASHGHGHEISLVGDAGHVDLVLSHSAPERHCTERDLHAAPAEPDAHVLHLTSADAGRDTGRRATEVAAAGSAVHALRGVPPAAALSEPPARLSLAPALVRSVVLRI